MDDRHYGMCSVELIHVNRGMARILKDTLAAFRGATEDLIAVCVDHWDELSILDSNDVIHAVEMLIHHTKENPLPLYPLFDRDNYKLPSYIRRAAIRSALGHVQSHQTRCDQYDEKREKVVDSGKHYRKMSPAFCFQPNLFPTIYKQESFKRFENSVEIKVRIRNTWDWAKLKISASDYKSLCKAMARGTLKNPKLVYRYHKFYLDFPVYYKSVEFPKTALSEQRVLGTDLGLNHGAVCSVCDGKGKIHDRMFDPFKREREEIDHLINLIRKTARTSGSKQSLSALYTKLQGCKENYSNQLARWIVNQAIRHQVYGIILEHLSSLKRGKKRKSLKARVQHWCIAKIRKLIQGMAFREGVRVFLINPFGTSAYAYDGSGKVERDKDNFSMCTFQNGKRYHCDLSASYNIAARYFIRAYKKSMTEKAWSELTAKVPELSKRTNWTLAMWRTLSA